MPKNYRLIAIDMDGTLLTSDKKILAETIADLQRAADAGKYIVLATGRGLAELQDYMDSLSFVEYAVCISGALVYDFRQKQAIHAQTISPALADLIMQRCRLEEPMVHFLTDDKAYMQRSHIDHIADYHMEVYLDLYERVTEKYDDIYSLYPTLERFEKINFYHHSVESRNRTMERLKDLPVSMTFAEETSLEIVAKGVSKAFGFYKLCDHLHINPSETIAIGDAWNDSEIMQAVGLPIAMGNATPELVRLCDVVVADNDHNGVGEAVRKYLLSD